MRVYDKAGWITAILILCFGLGLTLSFKSTYYDRIEITPEVPATYEWEISPIGIVIGEVLWPMALTSGVALVLGLLCRFIVKNEEEDC